MGCAASFGMHNDGAPPWFAATRSMPLTMASGGSTIFSAPMLTRTHKDYKEIFADGHPDELSAHVYQAKLPPGYYRLCDVLVTSATDNPPDSFIVQDTPNGQLAPPVGALCKFELVFDDLIFGVYELTPPDGFISMGFVATNDGQAPKLEEYRCVSKSLSHKEATIPSSPTWTDPTGRYAIYNMQPDSWTDFFPTHGFVACDTQDKPNHKPTRLLKKH